MTELYSWNPMSHIVNVECEACKKEANFEFAECVLIKLRKDVPYFQKSKTFEYNFIQNSDGQNRHFAFYYHGSGVAALDSISDLPEGYYSSQWSHSQYLVRSHGFDVGAVYCPSCRRAKKHTLDWPTDAYYKIEYRGDLLWAFNKESALALRDYIESDARKKSGRKWGGFLMKIPAQFQVKKARPTIVKKLNKKLGIS